MRIATWAVPLLLTATCFADQPATFYVFPAGGRRGETVNVRVGGLYLHDRCAWEMLGPGVTTSPELTSTKTVWFEGPVIPLPASQQQEDYPKDMAGTVTIAADATPGYRAWRTWTSQGACPARVFVVGDLPEVVEEEVDGEPVPAAVTLPVTINGRVFPREDVDVWTFSGKAGRSVTCSALADSLGSPLKARLEIRDPHGLRVAESRPAPFSDAFVRFTPKEDGTYQVRIHDLQFGGLQHYVYRLTVTDGPWVDRIEPLGGRRGTTLTARLFGQGLPETVSIPLPADAPALFWQHGLPGGSATNLFPLHVEDLPEVQEPAANNQPSDVIATAIPALCNGAIEIPGDIDHWAFVAKKGETFTIGVTAGALASKLSAAVSVVDAKSQERAQGDDSGFAFTAPEDCPYWVRVADRFDSRGGPGFGYRLRIAPRETTNPLTLDMATDALTLERGKETKLAIKTRHPVSASDANWLKVDGLPPGVSFKASGKDQQWEIVFKADATAKIGPSRITIRGATTAPDQTATAVFRIPVQPAVEIDTLLLSVALPTPFKVKGVYEVKYAQRGGLFTRHFTLDRGGFTGPLTVSLGDKQARHLQGVTGPTITIPAEANEFDYTVYLPPWMEIGRTSRSVIMAVGNVTEPDGSQHKVSFTSVNQNEQIVALIDPGQLNVAATVPTLRGVPGQTVKVGVRVNRGVGVRSPAQVELVVPEHIRGVKAEPLTIAEDQNAGEVVVTFAADSNGPFNMPLTLRATARQQGRPIVAEARLELVP